MLLPPPLPPLLLFSPALSDTLVPLQVHLGDYGSVQDALAQLLHLVGCD